MRYGMWDIGCGYGVCGMGYGMWDVGYGDMGYGMWGMGYGDMGYGDTDLWGHQYVGTTSAPLAERGPFKGRYLPKAPPPPVGGAKASGRGHPGIHVIPVCPSISHRIPVLPVKTSAPS